VAEPVSGAGAGERPVGRGVSIALSRQAHDRSADRRVDADWFAQVWRDPGTRVLVVAGTRFRLVDGHVTWVSPEEAPDGVPVLLGDRDGVVHFAVVVEPGQIDATVDFYRQALDFDLTLAERIVTGDQAMYIKVVQSKSRAVTLTLIESDPAAEAGHVDDFLKDHGGAGVQHMALSTGDILASVGQIGDNGIELLSTPDAYYTLLAERVQPDRHSVEELRALNILLDEDHDGQLYQIFAKSVHPRNTIFLEIIERAGASTFGSSNIKSLYEAVETQRHRAGDSESK